MTPAEGSAEGAFQPLCRLDEVPDGGSAGFTVAGAGGSVAVMVLRRGAVVHTFVNACPHVGLSLDLVPGRFLNRERTHILCSNHGALFRIEDGGCVLGPCRGRGLTAVRSMVRNGTIYVANAA